MKVGPLARQLAFILASTLAAVATDAKSPTTFTQLATLDPSDAAADSQFGNPSAISGDTVVVGDIGAGAVYVFVKPSTGWQNATQIAKLTPSVSAGFFGGSVAISGRTIVVGASDANSDAGIVFVFVEPAGGWTDMTETAQLTGTSSFGLGLSVAVSGNTIVAGSSNAGYVFEKPSTGWADMTEVAQLSNASAYGSGSPVAISGNTIVVVASGCCNEGQNYPGEADVFVKPSTGWATKSIPDAALTGSDETADDFYGITVSVSGNTVVVGADYHHNQVGAAYVFVKPAAGWKSMTQTAELTAHDGEPNDQFGNAVSISGNIIAVGASYWDHNHTGQSGAIYTYIKPASGWRTTSRSSAELFPSASSTASYLGASVGIGSGVAMGGAPYATINNQTYEGAVFVFGP
jgi:hypothetical protein